MAAFGPENREQQLVGVGRGDVLLGPLAQEALDRFMQVDRPVGLLIAAAFIGADRDQVALVTVRGHQ